MTYKHKLAHAASADRIREAAKLDAVDAMEREGGRFLKMLALLWRVADSDNRTRIEVAFAPEFWPYWEAAYAKRPPKPAARFAIVNTDDRPCARNVAELRPDGTYYYVHPGLRDDRQFWAMTPSRPTPLEDFGLTWVAADGVLRARATRESVATYEDGRARRWQGEEEFEIKLTEDGQ
jgi:hypothetical protein